MFTKKAILVALLCIAVCAVFLLTRYGRLKTKYLTSHEVSTIQPLYAHPNMQLGIFYNRVGKCGSRSVILLMKTLSTRNGFHLHIDNGSFSGKLRISLQEQFKFVMSVEQMKPPFLYLAHLHFVDFVKFGALQPIYINLIRDPLARLVSAFYFTRFGDGRERTWSFSGPKKHLNLSFDECVLKNYSECTDPRRLFYIIPFFCGQSARCRLPSEQALRQAIINVENRYLVIGVLEEIDSFVKVLEKLLPQFFTGAYETWKTPDREELWKRKSTKTKQKVPPSAKAMAVMTERLKLEYKFYNYVKFKFQNLKRELKIT